MVAFAASARRAVTSRNHHVDHAGNGCASRPLSPRTRELAESHYENFSVISLLLPRHLKQDFCNVYAFCRTADDLGDEVKDVAQALAVGATKRLPDFPDLPGYRVYGYRADQEYHLEVFCEKSTMNDILVPLCERLKGIFSI